LLIAKLSWVITVTVPGAGFGVAVGGTALAVGAAVGGTLVGCTALGAAWGRFAVAGGIVGMGVATAQAAKMSGRAIRAIRLSMVG